MVTTGATSSYEKVVCVVSTLLAASVSRTESVIIPLDDGVGISEPFS